MTDQVVETHCSTLVLVGDLVYKRKKPVDLGFLDFRALDTRRAACEAEVVLNRRFSPGAYLGVATLTGPETPWGEPLVVMRRMPASRRLSRVVATDEDVRAPLEVLASLLAEVHRASPVPARSRVTGSAASLLTRWQDLGATLAVHEDVVPEQDRELVLAAAAEYLAGRSSLLAARSGRVVDGHGDLLADDVYLLDDGPRPLDCLEFDERLRVGDGLLDAAFLAMDLEHLGRADLARLFLDAYRAAADDDAPVSLEHHYLAYRALVRAAVASVRARQSGDESDAARARELTALSLAHLGAGRVRLVVVGGLPGSGKTTVAAGLATDLGAVVLSSDLTRKQLHGLPTSPSTAPGDIPLGAGRYAPDATGRVYEALLAEARRLLAAGTSVVLDATFGAAGHREAARAVARETSSRLTELHCAVEGSVADQRIARRQRSPSDATPDVRTWLADREAPWPEAVGIDTSGDPATTTASALRAVRSGSAS